MLLLASVGWLSLHHHHHHEPSSSSSAYLHGAILLDDAARGLDGQEGPTTAHELLLLQQGHLHDCSAYSDTQTEDVPPPLLLPWWRLTAMRTKLLLCR